MSTPRAGEQDDGHRQEQRPGGKARWRYAQPALGLLLAGLSLYSLGKIADPQAALALVGGARWPALALAVLLLVASLAAKSLRWRSLLPGGEPLDRTEAYRIFHVSMLMNNVLPFRLGDGVRVLSPAIRRRVTASQAVMVLVAERLVDVVVLVGLAVIAAPWVGRLLPLPSAEPLEDAAESAAQGVTGAMPFAAGLALSIAAGILLVRALPPRYRPASLVAGAVGRFGALWADAVTVVRVDRAKGARMLAWTALAWVGTVWLHYLLLEALGIRGDVSVAVAVTLSTNLSMAIPTAPAHIGVFHAAAAAPLLASGTSSDSALAYAVLVHAVNTVPAMLIGLACLLATSRLIPRRRRALSPGG